MYELSEGDENLLVVPRILLRTKEIRRSVARLEFEGRGTVSYLTPSGAASLSQAADERRPRPVSDDDFLDHLSKSGQGAAVPRVRELIDFLRSEQHLTLRPTSTGLSVRMPDPRNAAQLMTLFWLDLKGINFYYLRLHLAKAGILADYIADQFYASVDKAFGAGLHPATPGAKEKAAPYPNQVAFTKLERGLPEFRGAISRVVAAVQAASTKLDPNTDEREGSDG